MRRAAAICSLMLGLAIGCASGSRSGRGAAPVTRLKILTYNIHHAEGTDGELDVERIARVIRGADPDLVALQEVDDRAQRTGQVRQAAELGRLTGLIPTFAQAMSFQGGGYGQSILCKWPVQTRTIYTLPQRAGREPRIAALISTRVGGSGPELLFVSTHLDHEMEAVRKEQAQRLNAILTTNQAPIILCGDFNAGPESGTMQVFSADWVDAASAAPQPTIPAPTPTRRIDYILLRPHQSWRLIETKVLEEPLASDHRPVLAVVELLP